MREIKSLSQPRNVFAWQLGQTAQRLPPNPCASAGESSAAHVRVRDRAAARRPDRRYPENGWVGSYEDGVGVKTSEIKRKNQANECRMRSWQNEQSKCRKKSSDSFKNLNIATIAVHGIMAIEAMMRHEDIAHLTDQFTIRDYLIGRIYCRRSFCLICIGLMASER